MEGSGVVGSPANPAPLGLAGFAMTTFILSMVNSNLVGVTSTGGAVALAFAYGGARFSCWRGCGSSALVTRAGRCILVVNGAPPRSGSRFS